MSLAACTEGLWTEVQAEAIPCHMKVNSSKWYFNEAGPLFFWSGHAVARGSVSM